jgi:hypothetical protein
MVLPGRLCELFFYEDAGGRVRVTEFAPPTKDRPTLKRAIEEVRILDRTQRALAAGQSEFAPLLLPPLLNGLDGDPQAMAKSLDPARLLIALYLMFLERQSQPPIPAQGKRSSLREIAKQMVEMYPSLPDGHVALALSYETGEDQNKELARAGYATAIEQGFPIVSRFLRLMRAGIDRYEIQHAAKHLLDEADEGSSSTQLWSVWRPPTERIA